jgi:hypothetical protein
MKLAFRLGLPLVVVAIVVVSPIESASPQSASPYLPVVAGTRVRVTTAAGDRRVGTLVGASRDSLVVQWDSRARDTLARASAKGEVRTWTRLPLFVGATLGVVAGLATAGMIEETQNHCDNTPGNYCPLIGKFGNGISKNGYSFGAGGLVLGLLAGATVAQRWRPLGSSVTASGWRFDLPADGAGVRVAYAASF